MDLETLFVDEYHGGGVDNICVACKLIKSQIVVKNGENVRVYVCSKNNFIIDTYPDVIAINDCDDFVIIGGARGARAGSRRALRDGGGRRREGCGRRRGERRRRGYDI